MDIEQVAYRPPGEYALDLEVFSIAELRHRIDIAKFSAAHRIEFHQLIYVTKGTCTHTVDFKSVQCSTGTLLTLHPAQAQKFDTQSNWEGWIFIFRPEFLLPQQLLGSIVDAKVTVDLNDLPEKLVLTPEQSDTLAALMLQMHKDSMLQAPTSDLNNLLRHQLYALLLRLQIFHGQHLSKAALEVASLLRFKRFQQLVERDFSKFHQVSDYANAMGCAAKSLSRAVSDAVGTTAKSYISGRICLEAKRLLAHTDLPVGLISDRIGFDEATNFVKFFKRETGYLPTDFRRQYIGG